MTAAERTDLLDFDPAALLLTVEGDNALGQELCRLFMEQITLDMESISQAIEDKKDEALDRAVHKLKGAASAVCARRTSALAGELGSIARSRDWARAPKGLVELQEAVRAGCAAMHDYVERKADPQSR